MNWNWVRSLAEDIGVPEAELMETIPIQCTAKLEVKIIPTNVQSLCDCCIE